MSRQELKAGACSGRYALADDVILVPIEDGSARVLDLAGRVYAVEPIGAKMLDAALNRSAEAAVTEIVEEYQAEPVQVRKDLDELIGGLEAKGMVMPHGEHRRRGRICLALASLMLAVAGPLVRRGSWALSARAWMLLAIARLSCAWFGWSATVTAWKRERRTVTADADNRMEATVRQVDEAVRSAAAKHLFKVECKERALCCWALSRAEGITAALVVGINPFPFAGHCWCEAGSWALSDDLGRITEYRPIVKYM